MTLNELADKTGVTASYLSQLERNIIDPSLSSLRKISSALGAPIYTFLDDEGKQTVVIRADKRLKLELPNSSMIYEFLTPTVSNKMISPKMEIIYFQMDPKSWSSEEPLIHAADECVFVLDGVIEVLLGEEKYVLNKGDSIYINENTPHRFYNPGEQKAFGTSTICPAIY